MPGPLQGLGIWFRPTAFFERCRARYGSTFTLRVRGSKPFVVLSDPDDIKAMFLAPADVVHCGDDGSSRIEKYTGQTGLAWLDENAHLARRRLLSRCMHGEAVPHMADSVAAITEREIAAWPRDEVFALHPVVHKMTLKVMRHVAFGPQQDERLDELVEVLTKMMQFNNKPPSVALIHTMRPSTLRLLTAFRPSGLHRFLQLRARADEIINDVVAERRRADADGKDLVSVLLSTTHEDGSPPDAVELRDEIMTTFLAGTESTANTLAWSMERLSREPAVRQRLVDEIDAGEDDAYLTATVQEVLRLRPPLPQIISRLVVKPIEIGGVCYQPGVHLWASGNLLHHDASIYPDPYAFRPERFLDNPPGTYTWIPFGGGRRRCLGNAIADLELKCVLREVLTRCEVSPERPQAEGVRSRNITIIPARGARVKLSDRRPRPAALTAH